jgi:hypothetical protein
VLREYAGWAGRVGGSKFVVVDTLQSAYLGQGILRLFLDLVSQISDLKPPMEYKEKVT